MTDPTRREFLAAAGGALASLGRRRPASRRRSSAGADPPADGRSPRTGRMAVEGIHAYTDRVSVAAGDVDPFPRQQLASLRAPGLPARAPTSTAPVATRSCIRSARRRPPSSRSTRARICIVDKPLDPRHRSAGLTLEVWIRRWRTIGRQAIIGQFDEPRRLRLRPVRQRGRLAGLLPRRRRRLRRGESAHDAARPTPDGGQSARA